jgi:hypothetical protein
VTLHADGGDCRFLCSWSSEACSEPVRVAGTALWCYRLVLPQLTTEVRNRWRMCWCLRGAPGVMESVVVQVADDMDDFNLSFVRNIRVADYDLRSCTRRVRKRVCLVRMKVEFRNRSKMRLPRAEGAGA